MGALSVLTGIGNIGEQFGEAKDAVRKESEARANKLREFSSQDAYLQLAKQQESRQQAEFEQRKKAGDLIEMKDGRIWSVSQGKFIDQQRPDPMVSLKRFIDAQPPEQRKALTERAQMEVESDPNDHKAATHAVLSYSDELRKDAERKAAAELEEKNRVEAAATRHQEHEEDLNAQRGFQASQREQQRDFLKAMIDYRGQGLTPTAEKVVYTTQPTLNQVDRLMSDIKKYGLEENNQSGYLFRARLKYAMGQASPEGTMADDIAGLSLGSVIEAGSAMQGTSRSVIALQKALQHTPNPWIDSPKLISHKLKEIRARLQDLKDDAIKYGTKRGVAPEQGGANAGGAMDPAVQQYLQEIGVNP